MSRHLWLLWSCWCNLHANFSWTSSSFIKLNLFQLACELQLLVKSSGQAFSNVLMFWNVFLKNFFMFSGWVLKISCRGRCQFENMWGIRLSNRLSLVKFCVAKQNAWSFHENISNKNLIINLDTPRLYFFLIVLRLPFKRIYEHKHTR